MIVKLLTEYPLEFLSLKGGLHRLVRVYTCQNATLLEITCHGSNHVHIILFNCSVAIKQVNLTMKY